MHQLRPIIIICSMFTLMPDSTLSDQLPDGFPPKEKICPVGNCREPFKLELVAADGSSFKQEFPYYVPVVQPIGVTIFPGEEITLSGDISNGKVVNIHLTNSDKEKPIIKYKFEQDANRGMTLEVVNSSSYTLKYQLAMMPLDKEQLFKTSSCPIKPGLNAYENWGFPIYQLLIPEIRVLSEGASMTCEF